MLFYVISEVKPYDIYESNNGDMQKQRTAFGKHPMVLRNTKVYTKILKEILEIDPKTRLIPTRFNPRKGSNNSLEILKDSENPKVIFIKILDKKVIQRFKIECRTKGSAQMIYLTLKEKFN